MFDRGRCEFGDLTRLASVPRLSSEAGKSDCASQVGEYSITGEDGKTYGLRSKSVNLSEHLGHKVTITGTLRPESAEKEKGEMTEHEKHEQHETTEAGDIQVSDVKMVSDKCQ